MANSSAPRVTLKQAALVMLAGVVFVAWTVFRGRLSCSSGDDKAKQGPHEAQGNESDPKLSALDTEGIAMANALRTFYPLAREADARLDGARECAKGRKGAVLAKCVADYDAELAALRSRMPSDQGLAGCALTAARAVRSAIDATVAEKQSAKPPRDADNLGREGVPFSDLHAGYRDCAARLFRVGALDRPTDAPTPSQLAGHLGLRDDEPPGPRTYSKDRPGRLWLSSGRELDRATLAVK